MQRSDHTRVIVNLATLNGEVVEICFTTYVI